MTRPTGELILKTIICSLLLIGCTQQPVYTQVELPLPPRPLLPSVTAADLACLPDDTYKRLVSRERAILDHTNILEAVIKSTHHD